MDRKLQQLIARLTARTIMTSPQTNSPKNEPDAGCAKTAPIPPILSYPRQ